MPRKDAPQSHVATPNGAPTGVMTIDSTPSPNREYLDQAVTSAEVSQMTGSSVAALAMLRSRGGGPVFVKLPYKGPDKLGRDRGRVRYLRGDVLEWLHARRCRNTAERP